MSIPIDIPGGEKLGELSGPPGGPEGGPLMQPGVQQSEEGGFRGIVLIGASSQAPHEAVSTHVCSMLRATSELAYADALAYIAGRGS
ncbi:hypothetical protein [Herbaspirillum aquaticum]|jgi:hypothetical protein|uniref:hypothetical protein n=1 Tax=Herbaspirillum aquaticum TaxID=568783 RepID=UPI001C708FBF|nr:hypothetical protein [Herbaspirillum aquaticum]MBW9333206.1 hypothetical protein [Herbaspirillum sp. RU 5E]